MREWSTFVMLLVVAAAAGLAGCEDPKAKQVAADQAEFDKAVELVNVANEGAVPLDGEAGATGKRQATTLSDFQRMKLTQALEDLGKLKTKGPQSQQAAAHRLLADIHSSFAREQVREAVTNWTAVSERSAVVLSQFMAVAGDHNRAVMRSEGESQLITTLQKDRGEVNDKVSDLQSQAQQLRSKIADHTTKADSLTKQAKSKRDQALAIRGQAREVTGRQHFNLLEQAIKAEREAAKLDADADLHQVQIDALSGELLVVQTKLDQAQDWAGSIAKQIAASQSRQSQADQARNAALTSKAQGAKNLQERFDLLNQDYDTNVRKLLAEASDHLAKATQELDEAVSKSQGEAQRDAKLSKLARIVDQAHLHAQHVVAAGGFGTTMTLLADRAAAFVPDSAAAFLDAADAAKAEQNEAAEAARAAVQAGMTLANELNSGREDDPIDVSAAKMAQILQTYPSRLDASMIKPLGQIVAAPAAPRPVPTPPATTTTPEPITPPQPPAVAPQPMQLGGPPVAPPQGDLPPLPDEAVSDEVFALVHLDSRTLNPQALEATIKQLLPPQMSQQILPQLGMATGGYNQFVQAGGKSILVAVPAPKQADAPPSEAVVMASLADGANEQALQAMLLSTNPSPPPVFGKTGQWMTAMPQGMTMPPPGGAARRALFEEAMAAHAGSPLSILVTPNAEMIAMAKAQASDPALGASLPIDINDARMNELMENAKWFAIAIKLGDDFGLYMTSRLENDAAAAEAKALLDEQIKQALAPQTADGQPNPVAMFAPMLQQAIKTNQDGDKVSFSLAGPMLKQLVAALSGMAQGFLGGGAGGPGFGPPTF